MGIIRPQLRRGNLEMVTVVVPGACSDLPMSITAFCSVYPWDLCIVMA